MALPSFILVAILLIRSIYKSNLVSAIEFPITKALYYLAGFIFVDNLEFNIMNQGNESVQDIIERAQKVLTK